MTGVLKPNTFAPTLSLTEDLLECLKHLEPADSTKPYALFETEKNPPNPGLCLRNGGAIGLSLSDGDAEILRKACRLSLLDKNGQAPVNETFSLPASEFELKNPAWATFVQG